MAENRTKSELHAAQAAKWIGEEPVAVSSPVDAQLSTTYALLALVDEVRALREALERGR